VATNNANTKVYVPVGVANTVTSVTGTSTSAVALPTGALKIWIVAAEPVAIIFGTSAVAAAVLATCMPIQGDTDYVFDVQAGVTHYRAIAVSTTGNLFVSQVG
jgi:hypothetical protein